MIKQSTRRMVARAIIGTLVISALGIAAATPVSAAKAGESCKQKDLYRIEKVGSSYIRCEIVPGTSMHASTKAAQARFAWRVTTASQFQLASANSDSIRLDGSSTVAPLAAVAAKYFENSSKSVNGKKGVKVTVGISGTGGGFEKFCKGETDMSNASRAIRSTESQACTKVGIDYQEVIIANDGLAVVVNPKNTWAKCLTMAEMKKIWEPNSATTNWSQVRTGFPNVPIKLYGAGTDSGTFDAFSEFVNGRSGVIRKENVSTSENDNVTVMGVTRDQGAMGYFGLSYAIENAKKVTAIQLDNGTGCVTPTVQTVQNYTYPMARPLYVYVKKSSIQTKPAVGAFVQFWVDNLRQISSDALFVPLTNKQIRTQQQEIAAIAKLPKVKK
jgi:phosphate transport system substrate-binding protein